MDDLGDFFLLPVFGIFFFCIRVRLVSHPLSALTMNYSTRHPCNERCSPPGIYTKVSNNISFVCLDAAAHKTRGLHLGSNINWLSLNDNQMSAVSISYIFSNPPPKKKKKKKRERERVCVWRITSWKGTRLQYYNITILHYYVWMLQFLRKWKGISFEMEPGGDPCSTLLNHTNKQTNKQTNKHVHYILINNTRK